MATKMVEKKNLSDALIAFCSELTSQLSSVSGYCTYTAAQLKQLLLYN
jgi:hypothetical protein